MIRIEDIMSDGLFAEFRDCAAAVDQLEMDRFLKANWFLETSRNMTRFGFKSRNSLEENCETDAHPDVDKPLQKKIYMALWSFYKETKPMWKMTGAQLLDKKVNVQNFRCEFQMVDTGAEFKKHRHPYSQLNGTVYVYPEQSVGTVFHEPAHKIAPWVTNSAVAFRQELHSFHNDSADHRRFTINTFIETE